MGDRIIKVNGMSVRDYLDFRFQTGGETELVLEIRKRSGEEWDLTLGTTFAFLGDEIYLRAGISIPSRQHYGDYPQIGDGIGMVRAFDNDFKALWKKLERIQPVDREHLAGR